MIDNSEFCNVMFKQHTKTTFLKKVGNGKVKVKKV